MSVKLSEAEFKAEKKAYWLKNKIFKRVFFIETESTEKGFTDALCVEQCDTSFFYEFKVTREDDNVIEFERNQPLWFKKNSVLNIYVIAYDHVTNLEHCFPADALFTEGSAYKLPLGSLRLKLPIHETCCTNRRIK